MTRVAVIAHAGKSIGGGLDELRSTLERAGVKEPHWSEVPKSKYASERVDRARQLDPHELHPCPASVCAVSVRPLVRHGRRIGGGW